MLVLAPIEPCATGNGLAMRVAATVSAAAAAGHDPTVAVVPLAGRLPSCPRPVDAPVVTIEPPSLAQLRSGLHARLSNAGWRHLLEQAGEMPPMAPPPLALGLSDAIVEVTGVEQGTPVHVVRSYLAPMGLAVVVGLAARWCTLDLDDDDEDLAGSDTPLGRAFHRLVSVFTPAYSALAAASAPDAVRLAARLGRPVAPLPNSVEVPALARRSSRGDTVLFTGNLTYPPNIDAAQILARDVAPRLATELVRDVHVVLVGPCAADGPVAALAGRSGSSGSAVEVTVTGFVPDLSGYLARAGVLAVPLQRGSGTRIKILEAAAHGLPVVTTPVGAAGLDVVDGEHLLLAADADTMAQRCAEVLREPALSQRLAGAAHEWVAAYHGPEAMGARLAQLFDQAADTGLTSLAVDLQ